MKIIFCIGKYEFIIRFLGKFNQIIKTKFYKLQIKKILKIIAYICMRVTLKQRYIVDFKRKFWE